MRASVSRTEIVRLVALFGLAAALTTAILTLSDAGSGTSSGSPLEGVLPLDAPPAGAPAEFVPVVPPWRPPVARLNELLDDASPDARSWPAPEAFRLLAAAVRDRPHFHFKHDPEFAGAGGFERVVQPRNLADPARAATLRGRPVEIVGDLLACGSVEPARLGLDPKDFGGPVLDGVVETAGQPVRFLLPAAGGGEAAGPPPSPGARTKVQGVFFRIEAIPEPSGAPAALRPVIIAKRVVPALPRVLSEPPAELPPGLGAAVESIESADPRRPPAQDAAFFTVLAWASAQPGIETTSQPPAPPRLGGRDPLERAADFRLRPVRARGHVVHLRRESFEFPEMRPEDAPVLGYWHAILADGDPAENVPVSVIIGTPALPEVLDAARADIDAGPGAGPGPGGPAPYVELTGVFYRVHAFANRQPDGERRFTRLPLVIAFPGARAATPPGPADLTGYWTVLFSVLGLLVLVLAVMFTLDRARSQRVDDALRASRMIRNRALTPPSSTGAFRRGDTPRGGPGGGAAAP